MISFDPNKLVTKHMHIKMVSGALGGTLTVLDPVRSKKAKKDVFTKIKIPHQLTRHFAKKYRITKYIKPVIAAVTFYEDKVVCIERHQLGNLGKEVVEGLFGERRWISDSETNIDRYLKPLLTGQDWFIDGSYVYHVSDIDLASAERLSADGKFRQVKVKALKLAELGDKPEIEDRVCLAFFPKAGDLALTPPIWKTLSNIGKRQISAKGDSVRDDIEDDNSVTYEEDENGESKVRAPRFDEIDEMLCVNLGFALKAGRELSEVFGYDSIEPLGLDDMMIQLKTVNLPNIANEVKQTFDTGLKFTIAIAWLIGMTKRVETLDSYIVLRTLLKHLTTKGVYRKNAFKPEAIFRAGQDLTAVKRISITEAKAVTKALTLDDFMRASRLAREIEKAGGLLGDEPQH